MQCGSGCEQFSERYLGSDYYISDLEEYGIRYNGGSTNCHVNIVNGSQIYYPPGFWESFANELWDNMVWIPTEEEIIRRIPKLFNKPALSRKKSALISTVVSCAMSALEQEMNGPNRPCDVYLVTITTTYYGGSIYGMAGISNPYTSQVTIRYGLEHGTGNLFVLPEN